MVSTGSRYGATTGRLWVVLLLLGIAVTVLGVLLITDPFAAATTLALLIGAALVVAGVNEALSAASNREGAGSVAYGVLLTIGGIIALIWPGITLWSLALLVGAFLILAGVTRAGLAAYAGRSGRPVLGDLLIGIAVVVVGLISIVWPSATIFILAVLFGIGMVIQGASQIALAMALRRGR
jgi:uncharacterized membrane protein HdeD (DUF308 family)